MARLPCKLFYEGTLKYVKVEQQLEFLKHSVSWLLNVWEGH